MTTVDLLAQMPALIELAQSLAVVLSWGVGVLVGARA